MGHITCKTVPTTGIIGVIAGDCFGAAYEFHPVKHGDFNIYKELIGGIKIRLKISIFYGEKVVHLADF